MQLQYLRQITVCAAMAAVAVACSKQSSTPVSPTASVEPGSEAAPDGSTLKVTAPTPVSPVNNAQPEQLQLTITKGVGKFNPNLAPSYEFEIKNAGGTTVCSGTVAGGGGTSLSFTPTCQLELDAPHTWRARAVLNGAVGPWSNAAAFRTATGGYIRDNEVYDPLVNGKTVGEIVGNVTFLPGVGVRLNDHGSHIRYRLPRTLTRGEFSLIITGVATNTEGDKTKVFAMAEGLDDIVTNDRRFTIEKRGDPEGIVAWRFITREDQIDTEGAEREFVSFDPNQPYLWSATWNGFFNLRIQRGGAGGTTVYSKGKPYSGEYDPNPHYAFIGSPSGRSGISAATVPGMIVRHVWISPNPRPTSIPN
jgi:hypothetical protein